MCFKTFTNVFLCKISFSLFWVIIFPSIIWHLIQTFQSINRVCFLGLQIAEALARYTNEVLAEPGIAAEEEMMSLPWKIIIYESFYTE